MSLERRALKALRVGSGIYLSLGGLSVIRAETMDRIGILAPVWTLILILALCGLATLLLRSHGWSLLLLPALLLPLPWLPLPGSGSLPVVARSSRLGDLGGARVRRDARRHTFD